MIPPGRRGPLRTLAFTRRPRWTVRIAAVAVVVTASALVGVGPADAATNLIQNDGMETLGADGFPTCWEKSGYGNNDFTFSIVPQAHGGTKAVQITMPRRVDGDRKAMMLESTACAPKVVAGKQYDLSVWYKTNTPNTLITAFRHDTVQGWQYWMDLKQLPVTATFANGVVRTPVVPPNTDQITWGATIYGVGTLVTDDYTMTDPNEVPTTPTCTGGTACTKGSWQIVAAQSPARGIHDVVLRNGKVLLIAGSGNDPTAFAAGTFSTTVFDPATGTFTNIPTPADFFCAGHVQLPDGRVLVMGGNKAYPVAGGHGYEGLRTSYIFDPATNSYARTNDMNAGHWYPSATVLGNGDVLSLGGLGEDSSGTVSTEYWSNAQQRWLGLNEVQQTYAFWGLYPSMVLMQDGRLFYTGSHVFGNGLPGSGASIYNYGAKSITDVPGLRNKDQRDQSASVLLPPAQDQRVMTVGGGNVESNPDANRLVDLIDLKQPNPTYVAGPQLPQGTNFVGGGPQTGAQGKMYLSTVILPDGKVFETGGALHNRADAVAEASMFDPATNTFTPGMATDPVQRGYHSSAALLPDGRVLTAGNNPGDGSFDNRLSIYSPPYLFKGARPAIATVANQNWAYGSTQQITVNGPVTSASLIRPAAVTHSSDPNQRSVALPMTVNGNNVGLNVTTNPNMAPPGWYMLFVTNAAGVPSIAKWVKVG